MSGLSSSSPDSGVPNLFRRTEQQKTGRKEPDQVGLYMYLADITITIKLIVECHFRLLRCQTRCSASAHRSSSYFDADPIPVKTVHCKGSVNF